MSILATSPSNAVRTLVAFAALISVVCTAAELPAVVEKPEVVIGESWIYAGYQNEKKFQIKVEIEQLSDREIRTVVTPNGNSAFAKPQAFDRQWNLVEAVDDRNRSVKYSPYLPALDFPLHIGKTWKKNYEWQRSDPRGIEPLPASSPKTWKEVQDQRTGDNRTWGGSRVEARVLGWEEITVPAGTYTAIKIEILSPHYAGSETSRIFGRKELAGGMLELYWYAPKIKRHIKYIARLYVNEKLVTSAGLDLVEYKEASAASNHGKGQGQPITSDAEK